MLASQLKDEIATGKKDAELHNLYKERLELQKQRYEEALEKFINLYGDKEVCVISVPGRSEIIGNHTDHQQGQVLAASIDLDMIAIVAKRDDGIIKVLSDDYDIPAIDLSDLSVHKKEMETSQGLIRGVAFKIEEEGGKVGGFDAFITSEVLQGSGLSSSAAFEVLIGNIFSNLYNEGLLDPAQIARIGQFAENVYFGKPCGLMDQSACSIGGLVYIDFQNKEEPSMERIEIDFSDFETALCITDVHASHADLVQEYAEIPLELKMVNTHFGQDVLREVDEHQFYEQLPTLRKELKNDRALLRAFHVFEENKRVQNAVEALKKEDLIAFENEILASGNSSFKYLQNVYPIRDPKNQALALALALSEHILQGRGAYRIHGGGFAGTIQAFVPNNLIERYQAQLDDVFGKGACRVLQIRPFGGIQVF